MKVFYILFLLFFFSCKVVTTQNTVTKNESEKKYQKELKKITKSYIKNSPKNILQDVTNLRVVYDTGDTK